MYCRLLCPNAPSHVFLVLFGHFHHAEVRRFVFKSFIINQLMRYFTQDICAYFQKQDSCGVLWDTCGGEIGCRVHSVCSQTIHVRRPLPDPGRRFQLVRDRRQLPAHDSSELNWYRVWYVVASVLIVGVKFRGLTIVPWHIEISAFLVIVWYIYWNKGAIKFSALVRTIAGDATVYFLVVVATQVYIQLSLSLMMVQSPVPLYFMTRSLTPNTHRVHRRVFWLREPFYAPCGCTSIRLCVGKNVSQTATAPAAESCTTRVIR